MAIHRKGFVMVPNDILQNPDLGLRDKGLYAYLRSYADNQTGETTVSLYKIAAECDITVATVKRGLTTLQKKGYISRKVRGRGNTAMTTILK